MEFFNSEFIGIVISIIGAVLTALHVSGKTRGVILDILHAMAPIVVRLVRQRTAGVHDVTGALTDAAAEGVRAAMKTEAVSELVGHVPAIARAAAPLVGVNVSKTADALIEAAVNTEKTIAHLAEKKR